MLYHKRGERKGFDSFGTPRTARALLSEGSKVGRFIKAACEKYMLSMTLKNHFAIEFNLSCVFSTKCVQNLKFFWRYFKVMSMLFLHGAGKL